MSWFPTSKARRPTGARPADWSRKPAGCKVAAAAGDIRHEEQCRALVTQYKASVPHLRPGSAIINTTSIQAYQPSPTTAGLCDLESRDPQFTKDLAQELVPKGIRGNAVAPRPHLDTADSRHHARTDERHIPARARW
jgi:NADP-dependent 3-hydroxy acid dehydrogenase YdfG